MCSEMNEEAEEDLKQIKPLNPEVRSLHCAVLKDHKDKKKKSTK